MCHCYLKQDGVRGGGGPHTRALQEKFKSGLGMGVFLVNSELKFQSGCVCGGGGKGGFW